MQRCTLARLLAGSQNARANAAGPPSNLPGVIEILRLLLLLALLGTTLVQNEARAADPGEPGGSSESVESLTLRAAGLRKQGELEQAIELLKHAIRIRPVPWLFFNLARCYEDQGRLELARSHYELCLGPSAERSVRVRALERLQMLEARAGPAMSGRAKRSPDEAVPGPASGRSEEQAGAAGPSRPAEGGELATAEASTSAQVGPASRSGAPLPAATSIELPWVHLSGGSFVLGPRRSDLAGPQVCGLSIPAFEMVRTEVTVGMYEACVSQGACAGPGSGRFCNWGRTGRQEHPINCVSWKQARDFAAWVGRGSRLCTEAEWEIAARSGKGYSYPWGEEKPSCQRTVMDYGGLGCGKDQTWEVGRRPGGNSEQGISDLIGNVWEWVADCHTGIYPDAPKDGSARPGPEGCDRVLRGGGWWDKPGSLKATARRGEPPDHRFGDIGLRLCRGADRGEGPRPRR